MILIINYFGRKDTTKGEICKNGCIVFGYYQIMCTFVTIEGLMILRPDEY